MFKQVPIRFKRGGLRQIEEERKQMNLNFKSSPIKNEELEAELVRRLDICICQVLAAIVDVVHTQLQWHEDTSLFFRQVEQCG